MSAYLNGVNGTNDQNIGDQNSNDGSYESLPRPEVNTPKKLQLEDIRNAILSPMSNDESDDWASMFADLMPSTKPLSFGVDNESIYTSQAEESNMLSNSSLAYKSSASLAYKSSTSLANKVFTWIEDTEKSPAPQKILRHAESNIITSKALTEKNCSPIEIQIAKDNHDHFKTGAELGLNHSEQEKVIETTEQEKANETTMTAEQKQVRADTIPSSTDISELSSLRAQLDGERTKRKATDALLVKLYQELQKMKVVTTVTKKYQLISDLNKEIEHLEKRKQSMEKEQKNGKSITLDPILSRIEAMETSETRNELLIIVKSVKTEVVGQFASVQLTKKDIELLEITREKKTEEIQRLQKELDAMRNFLYETKQERLDDLKNEVKAKVNIVDLPEESIIKIDNNVHPNTNTAEGGTELPIPISLQPSKKTPTGKNWATDIKSSLSKVGNSIQHLASKSSENLQDQSAGPDRAYHKFLPHSYRTPKKCSVCSEQLWGVKELRCETCGFHSHSECSKSAGLCKSSKPKTKESLTVFGVPLSSITSPEEPVPFFVRCCIEIVEAKGLDMEGIYRKSGSSTKVVALRQLFNSGKVPTVAEVESQFELTSITSAFKQFLRELPDSLIQIKVHQPLMETLRKPVPQRTEDILKIIRSEPKENYATLAYLMKHLYAIKSHASANLMVTTNLAVVFAPTIMKALNPQADLTDSTFKLAVCEILIDKAPEIFQ